jgi:hypothetical protein
MYNTNVCSNSTCPCKYGRNNLDTIDLYAACKYGNFPSSCPSFLAHGLLVHIVQKRSTYASVLPMEQTFPRPTAVEKISESLGHGKNRKRHHCV